MSSRLFIGNCLVKISASLVSPGSFKTLRHLADIASLTECLKIIDVSLESVISVLDVDFTTLPFSKKLYVGPSIGIPSHCKFVRSALTFSMAICAAINSSPNVEVSNIFFSLRTNQSLCFSNKREFQCVSGKSDSLLRDLHLQNMD